MYGAGIDLGSTQSKGIILDEDQRILGRALTSTGVNLIKTAEKTLALALEDAGLDSSEISYVVGTGYGRYRVKFGHTQISEISCHAKGAKFIFPFTNTVLDIGGQDTKSIKVGHEGDVLDFNMNDKCAAGTGRFLDMAAYSLGLKLDDIGMMSLRSQMPVRFSSTCTVFVETEIFQHLSTGKKPEDLLKGIYKAISNRCKALMSRVGIEEEITFTGGVSKNIGVVRTLEETFETKINVSEESHYMGALGAALFALERLSLPTSLEEERIG
ncbi:acyl-CoA dehydratase activase [Thermodesulfobacteriota bacterium]